MGWIRYTRTEFVKPRTISEEQFNFYKSKLNRNPSFDFNSDDESFTEHFEPFFKIIGIGLIGGFIIMMIGGELFDGSNWLALFMIPGMLLFLAGFFAIFQLFLEAPSYAAYKRKKRNYFEGLKIAIQESDDYEAFVRNFYL
jgi:hypothetical protein